MILWGEFSITLEIIAILAIIQAVKSFRSFVYQIRSILQDDLVLFRFFTAISCRSSGYWSLEMSHFNMNALFIIFRNFFRNFPFSLHRSGIILYVIFYKIGGNIACFCAGFSVFYTSIKYISKKCSKKIFRRNSSVG